ncbi:MAG: hypothetical protein BWY75_03734 [bacterium ADurb.Bin425]|nr:MAG: hypothetical protein BWY75_03734 [bacterium ADurb.Bin425]
MRQGAAFVGRLTDGCIAGIHSCTAKIAFCHGDKAPVEKKLYFWGVEDIICENFDRGNASHYVVLPHM